MADGHVNKCIECNKIDVRLNRKKNVDYYDNYDKLRSTEKHRVLKKREQSKEYTKAEPLKRKAQGLVGNAIKNGVLKRSNVCEYCGKECKTHAHHSSYSREMWLIVTWLCAKCHNRLHNDMKYRLNDYSDVSSVELEQVASTH